MNDFDLGGTLISLIVGLPLVSSAVTLVLRRHGRWRDLVTIVTLVVVTAASVWLAIEVEGDGTVVLLVGDWTPELGIALVADLFAVLVLPVALATIALVEVFAIGQRASSAGADPTIVGPTLLVLTSGVALSILTGDLFTLFVAFELMLVASYVLLTHQGRHGQVRSGMTYVVINLFASTLFLFGIAFVYAATGTVNMALLVERVADLDDPVRLGIGVWFLVVFGTKAAMFPLFSWLPDSYPTAPTTITAVFAGLLTKIGVYVMIRFHVLTGMDDLGGLILIIAGLTMIVGVAGALAQDDMKRILSFHIVSQIGYMMMGLGLFTVAGVAGAVLFLVHQIPVKTVLFLTAGLVEHDRGTAALGRLGGLVSKRPFTATMFGLAALSLAGLPPFSGFVAKLALVDAGIDVSSTVIVVVALVGSALTLLSMVKIWAGAFWGAEPEPDPDGGPGAGGPGGVAAEAVRPEPVTRRERVGRGTMTAATGAMVGLTIAIAVFAGPLFDDSTRAANDLLDGDPYVEAVLGQYEICCEDDDEAADEPRDEEASQP